MKIAVLVVAAGLAATGCTNDTAADRNPTPEDSPTSAQTVNPLPPAATPDPGPPVDDKRMPSGPVNP